LTPLDTLNNTEEDLDDSNIEISNHENENDNEEKIIIKMTS
jgi:hypothetical protein